MFEALTKGFREAQNRLAGLTELNPKNVQAALKEVRLSLLEADVELGVVKRFLATVEEKALGQTVQTRVRHSGETHRVSAGDQFVRICHEELVAMMDHEGEAVTFAESGPTGVMMVGLQGSGKTTTTAKLARWFEKQGKSPLLVAADMQRPGRRRAAQGAGRAAVHPRCSTSKGARRSRLCSAAREEAKKQKRGRHHL